MSAGFRARLQGWRDELAAVDAGSLSGDECRVLAEELAATAKACAAAAAVVAARAAACGAHQASGFTDPADWLARAAGASVRVARAALDAAVAVDGCPRTAEAFREGRLSVDEAAEIAGTEAVRPGVEAELLALAGTASLATLRDRARARRAEVLDPEELHRRQHRARRLRHWRDGEGMVCLWAALPPEVGVPLVNRLDVAADRTRRVARRGGGDEPRAAYAADALVGLLAGGGGSGPARRAELVVVCDLRAWRRGHVRPGEPCHVVGGGPVPVSLARELTTDAFVKAVVHDGVRVDTVVHYGRHLKAELRTALELGGPPAFDGVRCVEEGCGRRYGLEWDHVDPIAHGGPTSAENLAPRCWPHHRDKTERDRLAGLLGPRRPAGRSP